MKKKYFCIVILSFLFCFNLSVRALTYGGCEYSEISRLKSFVSNVNLKYDYYIENNKAYFSVTISNLIPGVYFKDSQTTKEYHYYDAIDGEITINGYDDTDGRYMFYSALNNCYGIKLSDKYYKFPIYNAYYNDPLCEENRNFSLCKKWIKVNYSYNEFVKKIEEYKNSDEIDDDDQNEPIYKKSFIDDIVSFYVKYYYIILLSIIIVCVVIMLINKRKNRFDL